MLKYRHYGLYSDVPPTYKENVQLWIEIKERVEMIIDTDHKHSLMDQMDQFIISAVNKIGFFS